MKRRQYLVTALSALVAGCSQSSDSSSNSPPDPAYQEVTKPDLLLSVGGFPGGWDWEDQRDEDTDAVVTSGDGSVVVRLQVDIHDTVPDAQDQYENEEGAFRVPEPLDIGDEAFWDTRVESAFAIFRDDVPGLVTALRDQPTAARNSLAGM